MNWKKFQVESCYPQGKVNGHRMCVFIGHIISNFLFWKIKSERMVFIYVINNKFYYERLRTQEEWDNEYSFGFGKICEINFATQMIDHFKKGTPIPKRCLEIDNTSDEYLFLYNMLKNKYPSEFDDSKSIFRRRKIKIFSDGN